MFRSRIARLLPLVLVVGLVGPACIVHDHAEADLTFFWSFEGRGCYESGVADTYVEIWDGPHLVAKERVRCNASGVTLLGFEPGYYEFRIYGVSWDGLVLYENSGRIDAHPGDNEYDVELGWAGY